MFASVVVCFGMLHFHCIGELCSVIMFFFVVCFVCLCHAALHKFVGVSQRFGLCKIPLLLFFSALRSCFPGNQIPFGSLWPSGARKLQRALVVPTLGSILLGGSARRFSWSVPVYFCEGSEPRAIWLVGENR